jgi:hypothetical protein
MDFAHPPEHGSGITLGLRVLPDSVSARLRDNPFSSVQQPLKDLE